MHRAVTKQGIVADSKILIPVAGTGQYFMLGGGFGGQDIGPDSGDQIARW